MSDALWYLWGTTLILAGEGFFRVLCLVLATTPADMGLV